MSTRDDGRNGIGDDYNVGYGKPPNEYRFKKGRSGNPKGRPKSKKKGAVDIGGFLCEPIRAKLSGRSREISIFEASLRTLAKKALDGNPQAIIKFIRTCEEYGAIAPPPAQVSGGVIVAPKGVSPQEWVERHTELVPAKELEED